MRDKGEESQRHLKCPSLHEAISKRHKPLDLFTILTSCCLNWEVCWKCSRTSLHTSSVCCWRNATHFSTVKLRANCNQHLHFLNTGSVCVCVSINTQRKILFTGDSSLLITGTYLALIGHQLRYLLCCAILILTQLGFRVSQAEPKMLRQHGAGQWLDRDDDESQDEIKNWKKLKSGYCRTNTES